MSGRRWLLMLSVGVVAGLSSRTMRLDFFRLHFFRHPDRGVDGDHVRLI